MHHIINNKGPAANPKEIASHFNVIMMAGTVTTATFLSGVLYYLGHNRQALKRLQDEMRSTFSSIEAITSKALLTCVYLNAVVEEGLRIYPPAGAAHLSRIVPQGGCVISGRFIPEGVSLSSNFTISLSPTPLFSSTGPAILQSRCTCQKSITLTPITRHGYPSTPGPSFAILATFTRHHSSFPSDGLRPRPRARRAIS